MEWLWNAVLVWVGWNIVAPIMFLLTIVVVYVGYGMISVCIKNIKKKFKK